MVLVGVLVLEVDVSTIFSVMLNTWHSASGLVFPSKKRAKKNMSEIVKLMFVCTFQVKDVTLDTTLPAKINQHQVKTYEPNTE